MRSSRFRRRLDFSIGRARPSKPDIHPHGFVEKKRILGNGGNRIAQ